ncbi:hypothetical protein F5I97DRAFT_1666488 [Phlebopus sp. FC_14]|nr:hypothetical protein F5I97DRAFT_1666488 [Phlebopus sp. FC_14]
MYIARFAVKSDTPYSPRAIPNVQTVPSHKSSTRHRRNVRMDTCASSLPPPNSSLGAIQIGSLVMMFLLGISTLQAFHYFQNYPRDALWIKLLVVSVWLFAVGQAIAAISGLYSLTISQFGQIAAAEILDLPAGIACSVVLSGAVGPLVQCYFAHRVLVFSRKLYIPVLSWSLSLLRFTGSVCICVETLRHPALLVFYAQYGWLIATLLVGGACNDLIITASMCYYLRRERAGAIDRTAKMLDKLTTYSIETGLVTSLTAVTVYICYKLMPTNSIYLAIFMCLSEVFANTLFASLNSRIMNATQETCCRSKRALTSSCRVGIPGPSFTMKNMVDEENASTGRRHFGKMARSSLTPGMRDMRGGMRVDIGPFSVRSRCWFFFYECGLLILFFLVLFCFFVGLCVCVKDVIDVTRGGGHGEE